MQPRTSQTPLMKTLIAAAVLIIFAGGTWWYMSRRSSVEMTTPYQAVLLTNGSAYFGRLEGLGTPERPHPVQKAFIDGQAAQCGYCINGMIMQSAAFLTAHKNPSEADIKNALANNLCRCGTHARIVRAVKNAANA